MAIAQKLVALFTADTKHYEQGQKKIQKSTKETAEKAKGSILDVSQQSSKLASVAGAAFSSMSAGISIATASAESFNGAVVAAAGSMAAAFAAGGPIGLAIASLSTVGGLLLYNKNQAEAAAKALRDEYQKELIKTEQALNKLRDEYEKLRTEESAQHMARATGLPAAMFVDAQNRERELRALELAANAAERSYQALVARQRAGETIPLEDYRKSRTRFTSAVERLGLARRIHESRIRQGKEMPSPDDVPPLYQRKGPYVMRGMGDNQWRQYTMDEERRHRESMEARRKFIEAANKPAKVDK